MFFSKALLLLLSVGVASADGDEDHHVLVHAPRSESADETRSRSVLVSEGLDRPVPSPTPQPTASLLEDEVSTKALSPSMCIPPACIPGVPLTRRPTMPPPTLPPPPLSIRGDDSCRYGDADCNVCADDVEATFKRAMGTPGMTSKYWKWHLYWDSTYRPAGAGPAAGGLGSNLRYHIQGFVRTNNDTVRYAASHSNAPGNRGGYYFVEKTSTRNKLYAMHLSLTDHPNSVAELGQYVVSTQDGSDSVRFFDLRKIRESQNVKKYIPGIESGGGIGMARMADGSYLFVANTNNGLDDRYLQIYRWEGPLTAPTSVKLVTAAKYTQPSSWSGNYKGSDNLSLITECGTGRMYTIHASGDEKIMPVSKGHWRLSRLDWDDAAGKPKHTTVAGRGVSQDKRNCHLRSSGTVHVTRDHKLEFYCHERRIFKGLLSHDWFDFTLKQPK